MRSRVPDTASCPASSRFSTRLGRAGFWSHRITRHLPTVAAASVIIADRDAALGRQRAKALHLFNTTSASNWSHPAAYAYASWPLLSILRSVSLLVPVSRAELMAPCQANSGTTFTKIPAALSCKQMAGGIVLSSDWPVYSLLTRLPRGPHRH